MIFALGALALVVVLISVRSDRRLWIALAAGMQWLVVARYPEFPASNVFLTAAPLANVLIFLAAVNHPTAGRGRKLPWWAYVLPIMAILSIFYVQTVIDRDLATYQRVVWVTTVIAGVSVARAVNSRADLNGLLISFGAVGALTVTLSWVHLLQDPSVAFGGNYTRYASWGGNPNGVGTTLTLGSGALVAVSVFRRWPAKIIAGSVVASSLVFVILTSGRGNILLFSVVIAPLLVSFLRRRLLFAGALVAIGAYVAQRVVGSVQQSRFERLQSFVDEARVGLVERYWAEVSERPFFGLMFSSGERAQTLIGTPLDEHNAYLRLLYLGGISLAAPILFVAAKATLSGIGIWRERRGTSEGMAWLYLLCLMAGMLVFGFTMRLMYEPMGIWPLAHVIVLTIFLRFSAGDEQGRSLLDQSAVRKQQSLPS